ncbi:odorant receptor 67a-like isoform X2 [Atheta coriaria]
MVVIFLGLEIYELFVQFNLEKFSKPTINVANYAITHAMGTIELMLMYINRKKIGKIMTSLHNPPFAPDASRSGSSESRWIRETVLITEIVYIVFSIFLFITITSIFLECLYFCIVKPRDEWEMPFAPMSIGAFQKEWPIFEISVVYQLFEIIAFAYITLTSYLLMSAITAHIGIQFRIMANSLRTLKSRAKQQAGADRDNETIVNKNMEVLMRSYIKHHLDVLNLAEEMESLCSLMILFIFLFSVLLMCFILFFASLEPIGSVEFFHFFFYWWCIACQIGSYCYWGNELSDESEKIAQAAAEIDWIGSSKIITFAVQMIITRAQQPVYITAGKFVPLSMPTLMMLVKGSFSYFMVLKQTQDENELRQLTEIS